MSEPHPEQSHEIIHIFPVMQSRGRQFDPGQLHHLKTLFFPGI
jgi:hypothetical protein